MINRIVKEDIQEILKENLPWQSLSGKTVLITGANGFIPSYIVETLLALDFVKVIALVRNKEKALKKFEHHKDNPNFTLLVTDICEPANFEYEADIVVHAASQASPKYYGSDPVGTLKANTLGTYNMLEYSRKKNVSKFLFFSSCEVYGTIDSSLCKIDETYTGAFDPADVRSCYGESKRMGENMCVCYSHQYGIKTSILRPAHTYGPGLALDDGRVFCDFIKNALNSENIHINSDGRAKRKFLYISDFVRGFFTILFKGHDKAAYNITSDRQLSIKELAETVISICPQKNLSIEYAVNDTEGYLRSQSTGADFVSDKIKALGWLPRISEHDGLKRMMASYE